MHSIDEIRKVNKHYDEEVKKLNTIYENVRQINNNINLEEVKSTLNYAEAKELYELIQRRSSDEKIRHEFKQILNDKKIKEYPKINDVHYYPIINKIDSLSKDEKIKLDNLIKESYTSCRKAKEIKHLDTDIIEFLSNNSIIEKLYVFHCTCESIECSDKIITQDRFEKLKRYWEKSKNSLTTDEEDEEMRYGYFETGCYYDGSIEVCSLEDFNKNLLEVKYKVKSKPDMTLDYI